MGRARGSGIALIISATLSSEALLHAYCRHPRVVGNLDIDRQGRELGAPVHADLNLVWINRDMPGDDRENLLAQHRDQVGLS